MRLTIRTSLALKTLMFCAVNRDRIIRRHEIASAVGASENHLAQVIHQLARLGWLNTRRGRSGGLALGKAPEDISIGRIFREIEGVLPFSDCIGTENSPCPLVGACRLNCIMEEALEAFYQRLDRVTLAELVDDNAPLQRLLAVA